jgi:hypothetical protein
MKTIEDHPRFQELWMASNEVEAAVEDIVPGLSGDVGLAGAIGKPLREWQPDDLVVEVHVQSPAMAERLRPRVEDVLGDTPFQFRGTARVARTTSCNRDATPYRRIRSESRLLEPDSCLISARTLPTSEVLYQLSYAGAELILEVAIAARRGSRTRRSVLSAILAKMEAMTERWSDDRLDALDAKVDELGQRVDNGFNRLEARLDRMDARMEKGFARVDRRFERIDERFERIDDRFDAMQKLMIQVSVLVIVALIGLIATQL